MTTITAELRENYQVDITNGSHTWRADEPIDLGGDDTGPNPYDLLLGSLAACTTITVALYAKRKKIALQTVSAEYSFDRVHADDCATCDDDASGFIDRMTTEIFLDGDFTDEQRARLERVATRCPVHKTLERGIHFDETIHSG